MRHYNFAKYLIVNGYEATIFSSSAIHNSKKRIIKDNSKYYCDASEGVPFVFLKTSNYEGNGIKRVLNMLQYYFRLLSVAPKFEKPDLIIGSSVHPLACVAAIKLAKKFKCKCICEIRDLWPESFAAYGIVKKTNPIMKILYAVEKWIYKKADRIIFTMEGGKDYIIHKGWDSEIDLAKVSHINNGVDLPVFFENKEKYQLDDADLMNPKIFKVVYTGAISKVNNVRGIIDAAQIIQNMGYQNIEFLIYGDGTEKKSLEKYCHENGIVNVFFKGFVHKNYIPFILTQCNLNIIFFSKSPLIQFGLSANKLFEYFASGKPTLINIQMKYDLIEKYHCGKSLEDNTTKENLAAAIIEISAESKTKYLEYCNNALKAANDYDFKNLTDRLIEIVEKM